MVRTPTPLMLALFLLWNDFASAADPCFSRFAEPMDKFVSSTAKNCKAIERDEPSVCQRSVGERCQKSYNELKRIRSDICSGLASDRLFLESNDPSDGVVSQASSQNANAILNAGTFSVSENMAGSLASESGKLGSLARENEAAIRDSSCSKSSSLSVYSGRMKSIGENLSGAQAHLDSFAKNKMSDAATANTVAQTSVQRAKDLESLTPMVNGEGGSEGGISPAVPVAAGLGAAALALAALGSGTANPPLDLSPALPDADRYHGSSSGATQAPQFQGNADQFLEENGLLVDASFTDANRKQIAQAVNLFPECQRKHFRGVVIRNQPGMRFSRGALAGNCLPGQNVPARVYTIALNTQCDGYARSDLVVHELFHVLANKRGYYDLYTPSWNRQGYCPVSIYSRYQKNTVREDFAEAGRLAIYPGSGRRLGGSCVGAKIQAAHDIVMSCK